MGGGELCFFSLLLLFFFFFCMFLAFWRQKNFIFLISHSFRVLSVRFLFFDDRSLTFFFFLLNISLINQRVGFQMKCARVFYIDRSYIVGRNWELPANIVIDGCHQLSLPALPRWNSTKPSIFFTTAFKKYGLVIWFVGECIEWQKEWALTAADVSLGDVFVPLKDVHYTRDLVTSWDWAPSYH